MQTLDALEDRSDVSLSVVHIHRIQSAFDLEDDVLLIGSREIAVHIHLKSIDKSLHQKT